MSDDQSDPNQERINALIDKNLKLVFSDLEDEELPDRFKDLPDVLNAQDAQGHHETGPKE